MIKKENFKKVLEVLGFNKNKEIYSKKFDELNTELKVDFDKQELIYPEKDGLKVNDKTTSNFSSNENFVVFECVHRLLSQGYHPKHIELEKQWQLGHTGKSGKADIFISNNEGQSLLIIECKTHGSEYTKAIKILENDARNQLFSYLQQATSTKFLALYASDFVDAEVAQDYYLINVQDNKKLLENNTELKSFKDATTFEEKYAVWRDTYKKDYATIGLFEDNKAYDIGKSKYTLKDLKTVSSKDIQGKYHEFATIMRQHNVSGRENAFDKLVNLFLCKVVDEANNKDELKFYWKGVAYDDPFSLQDRLNHLYKVGMKKFLGEDITYIENAQIDDAFSVFADKPNMTKEKIKEFFKKLKFFTNNDFAFVDVHNEELFYQNFEVLLKIVKMLQDIKLTGSEDNQFLGDMFEGFLDQGVKQSEGQFFTPMPIVKFIINSLPIQDIQETQDNPKAIDYACGAGHFLNEVANNFDKKFHKNIVGIEKEYRLSKVAKVSSFMYGQDDIQIVYHDALSQPKTIKNDDYSILVANPPYSVKGFLETLSQKERNEYELINAIEEKSFSANNAIECFFIERAKQLLKKDGVAGIVLPSSILSKGSQNIASSKGNIYVQTREILLKYFDIIAIAEFGSGTFGKTGTNTVTLFLKRRADNPDIAKHLNYMVNSWFDGDFVTNEMFTDKDLLKAYTSHIEIELELYKTLLKNSYDKKLFEVEMFSEYAQEFLKLSETKKRKKQKYYKALSAKEKEQREQKELLKYIRLIEQDKLYYFCLAYLNKKEVLIVKAPSDGVKNKKFLGYEWSGRKGDEGIKYITSGNTIKLDEEAQALEQILNLSNIQTPLYNPKEKLDESKINTLIVKNFSDEIVNIPKALEGFVSKSRIVDMLDFSRKEFTKAFSLTPKRKIKIEFLENLLKFPKEKLSSFSITNPSKKEISHLPLDKTISFIEMSSVSNNGYIEQKIDKKYKDVKSGGFTYFIEDDILIAKITPSMENGKCAIANNLTNKIGFGSSEFHVIRVKESIANKYLFTILNNSEIREEAEKHMTGSSGHRRVPISFYENLEIPLPPLEIQKEIIKKCEVVDSEVVKANEEIEKAKKEIEQNFQNAFNKATQTFKLSDSESFTVSIGKRVLQKEVSEDSSLTPIYSANVFDVFGYIDKDILKDFSLDSVIWGIDGDWMVNFIKKEKPFYPTDHCGVLRIKNSELNAKYATWVLEQEGKQIGFSRTLRASIDRIKGITIKAPSRTEQDILVKKIKKLEDKIAKSKTIVKSASEKKQAILKEYL